MFSAKDIARRTPNGIIRKTPVSVRALPLSFCRTKTVNTVIWLNAAINLSALSPSILSKPRSAKTGN